MIFASIAVIAITKMDRGNHQIKDAVRELSLLSRDLFYKARLRNKTYRIVFKLDEEKEHRYWVESSSSVGPIDRKLESAQKTSGSDEKGADDAEESKGAMAPRGSFQPDMESVKEPRALPKPLKFQEIEIFGRSQSITEGLGYIHFLPQGFVEESAIHITGGEKLNWTLVVHPLTGKTQVLTSYIPLKEVRQQ